MNQTFTCGEPSEPAVACQRLITPLSFVGIIGVVALSLVSGLPTWVALAGWLSYHTRGTFPRDGFYNLACLVTGLGIGIVAESLMFKWQADLRFWALPAALLLATGGIWLMNFVTGIRNWPSYLIGVAVVFIAELDASMSSYLTLTAVVAMGAAVGALLDLMRKSIGVRFRNESGSEDG